MKEESWEKYDNQSRVAKENEFYFVTSNQQVKNEQLHATRPQDLVTRQVERLASHNREEA